MEVALDPLAFVVGGFDDPLSRSLEQRNPRPGVRAQPLVREREPCGARDLGDESGIVKEPFAMPERRLRLGKNGDRASCLWRELDRSAVGVDEARGLADRIRELEASIAEHDRQSFGDCLRRRRVRQLDHVAGEERLRPASAEPPHQKAERDGDERQLPHQPQAPVEFARGQVPPPQAERELDAEASNEDSRGDEHRPEQATRRRACTYEAMEDEREGADDPGDREDDPDLLENCLQSRARVHEDDVGRALTAPGLHWIEEERRHDTKPDDDRDVAAGLNRTRDRGKSRARVAQREVRDERWRRPGKRERDCERDRRASARQAELGQEGRERRQCEQECGAVAPVATERFECDGKDSKPGEKELRSSSGRPLPYPISGAACAVRRASAARRPAAAATTTPRVICGGRLRS